MRLLALAVLLAPVALAQSSDEPTPIGLSLTYGNPTPERALFPGDAAPEVNVGVRLASGIDLHVGYTSTRRDNTFISSREVEAVRLSDATKAGVVSLGYARRIGLPEVRARLSLGYDDYAASRTTLRPDSTDIFGPGGPERGYGLAVAEVDGGEASFVHTGLSASVGLPLSIGRVRVAPALGVAATTSSRLDGTLDAQNARWMPYVETPVTVRIRRVDATFRVRAGMTEGEYRRSPAALSFSGGPTTSNWRPVIEGAFGIGI